MERQGKKRRRLKPPPPPRLDDMVTFLFPFLNLDEGIRKGKRKGGREISDQDLERAVEALSGLVKLPYPPGYATSNREDFLQMHHDWKEVYTSLFKPQKIRIEGKDVLVYNHLTTQEIEWMEGLRALRPRFKEWPPNTEWITAIEAEIAALVMESCNINEDYYSRAKDPVSHILKNIG